MPDRYFIFLIKKTFRLGKAFYFKLQIFRVILAVYNLRSKIQNDSLIKYIDEQFHVENDSIYYLNLTKYDLVPDFVIPTCEQFLKDEGISLKE